MLKFLKNLFKKPEKVEEIEEIHIDKIKDWLNKQTSEIIEDIDKDINDLFSQLKEDVKEVKMHLEGLKKAGLRNDKIALRVKQIMEGNRVTYINRIHQFLDNIDLENKGFFSGKRFYKDFKEKILDLNKQTIKSFYVMQEFLAEESGRVAKALKKMDDRVKEMKELIEKSPIYNLDEIHASLKEFKEKQKALKDIDEQIEKKRKELEDFRLSREKVEKKITMLKKSKGYAGYKQSSMERDGLIKDIKKLEDELCSDFSALERPLKKYSRLAMNEKLVKKYATSPILALLSDKDMEIIDILRKLKEHIAESKVELKDKQKEKAIQTVEKLTKRHIEGFLNRHGSLKSKKKNLDTNILTNNVNQDYNDLIYKHEHFLKKCKQTIEYINDVEKSRGKINYKTIRKQLEDRYSHIAMKKIRFIDNKEKKDQKQSRTIGEQEKGQLRISEEQEKEQPNRSGEQEKQQPYDQKQHISEQKL